MARSSAGGGSGQGGGRGTGQGGGRGRGQGSGRGSGPGSTHNGGQLTTNASQSAHEPNDDDDVSVVAAGRGTVVPTPLPTPENRILIWIENDEFNIQREVSGNIGSILKTMWAGPWQGWKDVPFHHRERMFERFQKYYKWEDEWKSLIYSCWEKCIKGKFPDLLKRARDKAKTLAIQDGKEVENDLTAIIPFKPHWISQESWATLVGAWNTGSWKDKSSKNSDNRGKATGGRHTLGSRSFLTVRKNLDKALNRRASFGEFWVQTHAKKGSRPLDRLPAFSNAVGNGLEGVDDVEETIEEHNVTWVDTRAGDAYDTYNKSVIKKYGEDTSLHPEFDMELWSLAVGGKKKGRLYGTSPRIHSSHPPAPGTSDEVQRLKERIAELEQDKIEKHVMMEKIEENARLNAKMMERFQELIQNAP